MTKLKTMALFFGAQMLNFTLITVNYIAIAERNYLWTAVSDLVFTSVNFFIIKKIAESKGQVHEWVAYVAGSIAGSMLGIYIATAILGK